MVSVSEKTVFFNKERIKEVIFIFFIFVIFFVLSIIQPFDSCPDEAMRYKLVNFIFKNGYLPHGGNPEIINPTYGISYAFTPYLAAIVSSFFMKIISLFTNSESLLIIAARFTSVLAGTISVVYIIKIAKKIFAENIKAKWLFILGISLLPQYVFLGTYMNNDMLALMSISMIIYYWVLSYQKKWNIGCLIKLSVSLAFCILSYYNAYGFVLMSIIFFFLSCKDQKIKNTQIIKKFCIVFFITFMLAGWFFIRNAVMYNGDFLGLKTSSIYSNMYAPDSMKMGLRSTPYRDHESVLWFLLRWTKKTAFSFIGNFGYMNVGLPIYIYITYILYFILGIVLSIIYFIKKHKKSRNEKIFAICLLLGGTISIFLSLYYSYFVDFQPQGRYVMSLVFPLYYFITKGYALWEENAKVKSVYKNIIYYLAIIFLFFSFFVSFKVLICKYV